MPGKIKKSKYFFEEDFIETIGEVSDETYKPLPPNEKLNFVGKKIKRYDAYDKVSGGAEYTFDIKLPRMVFAKILRSHLPHAKIKSIDTTAAAKLKGVLEIFTHKNIDNIKWYGNSKLFDPVVRYEGDEIACVAAESEKIAEEALKLIKVEFEELPFTSTAEESSKPDAPKIYADGNMRGGKPENYSRGDIEAGFKQADEIVEADFSTEVAIHNPTEVHCSVVNWDGDKLTVYDSTQGVFSIQRSIARALKIPASKVRVITKYMGGGFGSKLETGKYTVIAAQIAKKLGRPVRIALSRKANNLAAGNRPDSNQKYRIGVKKDGTLTALELTNFGTGGAFSSNAQCSWPTRQIYKCANVSTSDATYFTNMGKGRPFRAPGHVQGAFGLESAIDMAAEKVGMDPLEFRLKNYSETDQVWGLKYTTKLLREAYKAGAEKIGWNRRNKIPGSGSGYIKRGIGMASQIWWGGGGPPAYVTIKMNDDASVNVLAGSQDLGTGTYTFVSQVAAEILDIPLENIKVIVGDTDVIPYGPSSGGSTTAPSLSPAVRDGAEKLKAKLIAGAAAILELDESALVFGGGKVKVKDGSKELSLKEIIRKQRLRTISAEGMREANPDGFLVQTFGAQFAEVEVDTLTGKVSVLKVVAAHDIGRVLNRQLLENQFHGGIMQGLGYALMEERIVDEDYGKVLNANMHDYKMPTMLDAPEIDVVIVSPGDDSANNMGVKGIGEPAIIPTAGAIANAVYNAIGARVHSLPITPDKVLKALYS